jgi:hypothetical protein
LCSAHFLGSSHFGPAECRPSAEGSQRSHNAFIGGWERGRERKKELVRDTRTYHIHCIRVCQQRPTTTCPDTKVTMPTPTRPCLLRPHPRHLAWGGMCSLPMRRRLLLLLHPVEPPHSWEPSCAVKRLFPCPSVRVEISLSMVVPFTTAAEHNKSWATTRPALRRRDAPIE